MAWHAYHRARGGNAELGRSLAQLQIGFSLNYKLKQSVLPRSSCRLIFSHRKHRSEAGHIRTPSHPRQSQLLEAAGVAVSVVSSHLEARQPHHSLLFSISIHLTRSCSHAADSFLRLRGVLCSRVSDGIDVGDPNAVGSGRH